MSIFIPYSEVFNYNNPYLYIVISEFRRGFTLFGALPLDETLILSIINRGDVHKSEIGTLHTVILSLQPLDEGRST